MSKDSTQATANPRFKPYPQYKDSGVEWLGDIPAHWEMKRLKFAAHLEAGQSPPSEVVTEGSDGLPFLQGNADFGPLNPMPRQICNVAPKRARTGDILLSVRAPVGAMNVADQEYGIGRGLCAITPAHGVDSRFAFYLLAITRRQLDAVATGSTYDAVTTSQVGDLLSLLPEPSEQHTIVAFLERETAKIDALVAEKERLIELLHEKRTALITQGVTKGLDLTVPMKDSGTSWLGKIPAHWDMKKLKHVSERVFVGIAEAATFAYADDGVPMLRSTDVRANRIRTDEIRFIDRHFADRLASKQLKTNDIVTVRTGNAGVSAVVPPEYNGGQCFTLVVTRPARRYDSRYFCYCLNSPLGQQQFAVEGMGTAQINISVPIVQNTIVCVPPPQEQTRIADWIDEEVARLDALMMKVRHAVESLKELRITIISVAVTGRIDVRGEEA